MGKGITLIEWVIIFIIVGLLAIISISRFLEVSEEVKKEYQTYNKYLKVKIGG